MSTEIDPYSLWLGLAPGKRPPHLYELLGLEPFCDDVSQVLESSRRQMACIKPYEDHPEPAVRAKVHDIMNHIGRARAVLRDPKKKSAYDRKLAEVLKQARPAAGRAPAAPESPTTHPSPKRAPAPEPQTPPPAQESAEPAPARLTVEGKSAPAEAPGQRGIELRIVEELGGVVDTVRLDADTESIIGRSEDCALCIDHASVSPRHARMTNRQGRWYITREDRSAEILVNGLACTQALLSDGDIIGIGVYELHVDLG